MLQERPVEALAPPVSMEDDLCETKPLMMMRPKQQHHNSAKKKRQHHKQRRAKPLPPTFDLKKQYLSDFAGSGYDKNRTLWIGDLMPWMDENYFKNFGHHVRKEVSVKVIRNKQTQSPEYAFIQLTSTRGADQIFWDYNGLPMPNSKKKFKFKWASWVCGLERPDGSFTYDITRDEPYSSIFYNSYRSLVSIEFVRVNNIVSAKHPVQLYGTVVFAPAYDEDNALVVYDQNAEDSERVSPGDYLTLTGPLHHTMADCGFFIGVDLLGVNLLGGSDNQIAKGETSGKDIAKGEMSPNQIVKGRFWWASEFNPPISESHKFDQLLEEDISCDLGSVTVSYTVFEYALYATLEVLLIKGNCGESPMVDVYGHICAMQKIGESGSCLVLFDMLENEPVQVQSNHAIPLTRPVVVIPITGLSIEVCLWDSQTHHQIVDEAVCFKAEPGIQKKSIGSGVWGEVQVFITCY